MIQIVCEFTLTINICPHLAWGGGQLNLSVSVFWQFDPGDTPRFLQLKSKIRLIFANFDQKSSVFGTVITNLTGNGAHYVVLTYKINI